MQDIRKVGLAVVRDNRLLVVRKRGTEAFLIPGGRREAGESSFQALRREVLEELGCRLVADGLERAGVFRDRAANEAGRNVEVELYLGEVEGPIRATGEIEELRWYDPLRDDVRALSAVVRNHIVPHLTGCGILAASGGNSA